MRASGRFPAPHGRGAGCRRHDDIVFLNDPGGVAEDDRVGLHAWVGEGRGQCDPVVTHDRVLHIAQQDGRTRKAFDPAAAAHS